MKTLITLFFLSFLIPCSGFQSPDDFNRNLSRIIGDFKEAIMDEDACEELKDDAEDIADEIEEILKESEDFSPEEILEFKQLKTDAENIEDFIAVVAGVGNAFPKTIDFKQINGKVHIGIYTLGKYDFCVDVQVAEIGSYKAYLVTNNSANNVRLKIIWKTANGARTGSSEVGMIGNSIRHILDNRDDSLENLIIQSITCTEF
ncbi:hypothetical protein [Maribacter hydrothermalis]|uniref:Uncharacterized protein n=1 Tax=Maribacter hydrothermalis TaxID=1836467 RepID=A0A1B7ZCJ3_9FLAO|nr:hypothetical protein [Maribacter hydrothermalis]APQ18598.1 hypothetical protein BTR34_15300 [Maribacter hydrothermalis]OBR40846.1 hypothetical protein A9200_14750 [Maribacter hydrothermalis]